MTLGHFLDAAYTVLAQEYQRIGTDLQTTLKELEPYRAGGPSEEETVEISAQPSRSHEAKQAAENERALAQLQQMMSGTSFG